MSELYRHLLIPSDAAFIPDVDKVASFYDDLRAVGALPKEASYKVLTYTGKTRLYGRNPNTGENYYGPELNVTRCGDLQGAIDVVRGEGSFELSAVGEGPTAIPPFDLYDADNYATRTPGPLRSAPYEFTVRCTLRPKMAHVLHRADCTCDLKPDEPAVFENPWSRQPIQTSGSACACFWIEFGIGDWLMPRVGESLDILDDRLVKSATNAFGLPFTQGCMRSDD